MSQQKLAALNKLSLDLSIYFLLNVQFRQQFFSHQNFILHGMVLAVF